MYIVHSRIRIRLRAHVINAQEKNVRTKNKSARNRCRRRGHGEDASEGEKKSKPAKLDSTKRYYNTAAPTDDVYHAFVAVYL